MWKSIHSEDEQSRLGKRNQLFSWISRRRVFLLLPPVFCIALAACGRDGGFSKTDRLHIERHGHAALRLEDGSVLIFGGLTKSRPLASVERFVPSKEAFELVPARLPKTSGWGAAALLPDGRALYTGGWLNATTSLSNGAFYLPKKNTLHPTGGELSTPRFDHTATSLSDGTVLITGGNDGRGRVPFTERYLPKEDRFAPGRRMLFAREQHTATRLQDGRVLIVGGNPEARREEIYDPEKGIFRPAGDPILDRRRRHTATLLPDGRVLIAGGWNDKLLGTAKVFDPRTESFKPTAGPLVHPRQQHAAVRLRDGSVLLVGGRGLDKTLRSVEIFDPRTGRFSVSPARLRRARRLFTATLLSDGRVLVVGGADDQEVLRSAEIFIPTKQ